MSRTGNYAVRAAEERVVACIYIRTLNTRGLVVTFAKDFINYYDMINVVRGLRAGNGQEEFDLAKIYYEDFGKLDSVSILRTVFFPVLADQLQTVSSTRVREYIRVGAMDYVHRHCPVAICESINNIIRETYVTKQ